MPELPLPWPPAIVLLTGLVALVGSVAFGARRAWAVFCLVGGVAASVALGYAATGGEGTGDDVRGLALVFDVLLLASGIGFHVMLAGLPPDGGDPFASRPEGALAPGLVMLSVGGAMLVALAADTLLLVLGLELTVVPLLVLLLRTPGGADMREAAVRFLASEAVALLAIVVGLSLWHAEIGSADLATMERATLHAADDAVEYRPSRLASIATVLLLCGLAIMARVAPFHVGVDRVHAATNAWTAGVLNVLPRIAVTVCLVKLVPLLANVDGGTARLVLLVLAMASLLAGGIGAQFRTNLREVLAAASMGAFGSVLACVAVGVWDRDHAAWSLISNPDLPGGIETAVVQLGLYVLVTVGLYATLVYLARPERSVDFEDDLSGLVRTEPAAAVALGVLVAALVGLPPLAGFWSRLLTLGAVVSVSGEAHRLYLVTAFVVGIGGVLLAAAFARWLMAAFFELQRTGVRPGGGEPALAVAVLLAVLVVGIGFVPATVLSWIRDAVAVR